MSSLAEMRHRVSARTTEPVEGLLESFRASLERERSSGTISARQQKEYYTRVVHHLVKAAILERVAIRSERLADRAQKWTRRLEKNW